MPSFTAEELARWTGGQWQSAPPNELIGLNFDTRTLKRGEGFVALTHGARDGHTFIKQAISKGAVCAIVERPCPVNLPQLLVPNSMEALSLIGSACRQNFKGTVLGITGSCGKTSTKSMLHAILALQGCHSTPGNWNNLIGVPMTLFGLNSAEHTYGVVEAGISCPNEMGQLGEMIAADLVLVTQLSASHLKGLGSMEMIAYEKSRLIAKAKPDAKVILTDSVLREPHFQAFAERTILVTESNANIEGLKPAKQVVFNETAGGIEIFGKEYSLASSSRGMRSNAALAIVAAHELGLESSVIQEAIARWQPDFYRGSSFVSDGQFYYLDCYNANPASMEDSLQAFVKDAPNELARGYVLGAMNELGELAETFHYKIAEGIQVRAEDRLWFVGPSDLIEAYREGALMSGFKKEQIQCVTGVEKIKSEVADFSGALFLKGSRSYNLEFLLPQSLNLK